MTIQGHQKHLFWALIALTLITGCPSGEPPRAPADTPREAPRVKASPKVAPATRPPRPVRAKAPSDKLHLLRTTGSVEGPIPYTVVAPAEESPKLPVVIALHGRGDRAEGFVRLVKRLRMPIRFVVGEGPMPWGMSAGKRWFDMRSKERDAQLTQRVNDLVTLADKVSKRWPEAPPPIVLGFSQGAMLALQAIAERPDRFAGAVALSGALLKREGLSKGGPTRPVLLATGHNDPVVPAARSTEASEALRALGHRTEVFTFQGGHTVPAEALSRVREALSAWTVSGDN